MFKKIILFILIFVFIIVGGYLLLKIQGLVLDLQNLKIIKTGSLAFSIYPTIEKIYLNNHQFKITPPLLSHFYLINNIKPGFYNLQINLPNYFSYNKNIFIKSGLTTNLNTIYLIPKTPSTFLLNQHITDAIISDNFIIYKKNNEILTNKTSIKGQEFYQLDQQNDLLITKNNKTYFFTNLIAPDSSININLLFNNLLVNKLNAQPTEIQAIFFHPFNKNHLLIQTKNKLYDLSLKNNITFIVSTTSTQYIAIGKTEIFLFNKNNLQIYNLILNTMTTISMPPFRIQNIQLLSNNNLIFILTTDGNLWIYQQNNKTFIPLLNHIKQFIVSPDDKWLIILTTKNVWFYDINSNKLIPTDLVNNDISNLQYGVVPDMFFFKQNNNLFISDMVMSPLNINKIADNIKKYFIQDKYIYVLDNNNNFYLINLNL
ncbi:MAG: hypothetical protein ACP5IC_01555 [Minisyncoccia bacterium]